jgi:peptide/nickel transport system substrate-binding protein
MKKITYLIGCFLLILGVVSVNAEVKNPDTFVLADIGSVETIDPAKCYDTAGSGKIWTVYETLVFFDGPHTGKYAPILATKVPTVENGGRSGRRTHVDAAGSVNR